MQIPRRQVSVLVLVAGIALWAGGCTNYRALREAQLAEAREDWDAAVVHYLDLSTRDPGDVRIKTALLRARIRASQAHFAKGKRFQEAGVLERALIEYQQAVQLDPTNQYVEVELDKVRKDLTSREQGTKPADTLEDLKKKTRDASAQPPVLNPRSKEPISLEFPKATSIFDIYRALGKAFGINVLFDPSLKDEEIAIELKDVTAQTALETLMRAAGHFYKVLDEHSILIAADNPQNRKNYEDLVVQTFFLSNAEVKDVLNLLRSLIGAKNLATDEQLNAVTIRDTADKVKVAQKIIEGIDKAKSEVIIDVELVQVSTTKLRDLGVSLSNYSIGQTLDLGKDVPIRLGDLKNLTQNSWSLTIPNILYDFIKTNTDAQLLAKPQIRISEGEKGKVHIGDRVPIPVTTFNAQSAQGNGSIVPITSFQYQDVGIKIEIEPRVHHNKEITLKLQIEISQITGFQDAGNGQQQPIIGTRNIESVIRLKDGETNFLAGLIRTDESTTDSGVPGISDVPVLGKLFGKTTSNVQRTDVMLTLTPHIIRSPDITEEDLLPIWVGTESNITFRGGSPKVESASEGPFEEGGEPGSPQAVEKKIRDQVQKLPRGLRSGAQGQGPGQGPATPQPQAPAPPLNLGSGSAPTNPFATPEPPKKPEPQEEEPPPPPQADLSESAPAPQPSTLSTLAPLPSTAFSGAAAVTLRISPQAASVQPGDRFEVSVEVETTSPVAHLPLTLGFDPAVLAVDSVAAGDFLGGSTHGTIVADTSTPGEIVLGASRRAGAAGVAGRGTLARITFRAVAPGTTTVAFRARRVMDPSRVELASVATLDGRVEVRSDPALAASTSVEVHRP